MPVNAHHMLPSGHHFHPAMAPYMVQPLVGHVPVRGGLFPPAPASFVFGQHPFMPTALPDVHRQQLATYMALQNYYRNAMFCQSSLQPAGPSPDLSSPPTSLSSQSPAGGKRCSSESRPHSDGTPAKFDFTKLGESIAEDTAHKSRTASSQLPAPVPTVPVWPTAVFGKPW